MKRIFISFFFILIYCTTIAFAHGGGIDVNGGHHDYNNVSGLGFYHYHCDGHSAHLHTDGICPYTSSSPPVSYASQLAKKEPTESDLNSAGRKDTRYIVEEPPIIEKEKLSENSINGLLNFLVQHYFTILICNFFIWLILRHIGNKIIQENLFLDKYFFIRRIIYVLHYANWGFALMILFLFAHD